MIRAFEVLAQGSWDSARRRSVAVLDFDHRCRRRVSLQTAGGLDFMLDLPQTRHLRDGDGLVLETGEIVEVRAAAEPLLEIRCDSHDRVVRVAWHLGNRHVPTELRPGALRIRADHVLADMAERLGAQVKPIEAAFDPESGAYAKPGLVHGHSHDHGHSHGHGHHDHHDSGATHGDGHLDRVVAFPSVPKSGHRDH